MLYYTDGSFNPYKKSAAWSYVKVENEAPVIKMSGVLDGKLTANRAELTAILEALKVCEEEAKIFSDSLYSVRSLMEWAPKWERNGWTRSEKNRRVPILNDDLIKPAFNLVCDKRAQLIWVRGHNGNRFNELADELCRRANGDYRNERVMCPHCNGCGYTTNKEEE